MSIKKYNTFCFRRLNKDLSNEEKPKIEYKNDFFKKRKNCIIGVLTLLVGITIFYTFFNNRTIPIGTNKIEKKAVETTHNGFTNVSNCDDDFLLEEGKGQIDREDVESSDEVCGCEETKGLDELDLERLNLRYQKADSESEIKKISGMLNTGETIYEYLTKVGILPSEILRLAEKVESVVDISRLNTGTRFTVHYNNIGKIVQFDYKPNQLDAYYIKIPENELGNIEVTKDEIYREIVCLEGEIKSSLYQSMVDYCNSGQLAVQLAEIFAWDIDFLTECQKGDSFKILVERQYRGDFYRWGDVLAAVYEGEMLSTHTAVLFQDNNGHSDYYDKDGRCLRKAFLKAPLNYKYISSYFTENRYHPILRINRPHLAIDYAAPTGTPVVAIGAGSVITKYYDKGGYGNYIELKHPNGYVTGYGHLSKFADGLAVGKRVEQGEIIGYVGATGLATGPHLDFSISINGKKVDFLNIDLPSAGSVSKENWDDFELVKKNYLSLLKEDV